MKPGPSVGHPVETRSICRSSCLERERERDRETERERERERERVLVKSWPPSKVLRERKRERERILVKSWPPSREREREREREMFYLTTHSTHFIYGYMAPDIWLRTILIVRKQTRCNHMGYSFRLTARVLLYAPSHRQDNTYHGLHYTFIIEICCYHMGYSFQLAARVLLYV